MPFSVLWKSIFRGISLPSTDVTHIRIKHSLKRNFLKNALQRGKVEFPHWCGKMKKEKYRKRDVSVSDLAENKNVSLPLFFLTCSISKSISLCLGKMFKLLLSPVSKIDALKTTRSSWRSMIAALLIADGTWWWCKTTQQRSTSNASEVPLHKYTLYVTFSYFSLPLPSLEVPMNFYSNSTYSVTTLLLSPT